MQPEERLFTCQMCEECCYGENTICLTPADIGRMSAGLELSEEEFLGDYCVRKNSYVQMKVVDNHCIFWNGTCTVHVFKPGRCRQWPFVPSLLDKSSFLTIQQNCPGFDKNIAHEDALPHIREILGRGETAR